MQKFWPILLTVVFVSCQTNKTQIENDIIVKVNPDKIYQVIDGFGASDAWRCQHLGRYWPQEKKEKMAEWLFSQEIDDNGNPKGIGLSLWRFYLGAGSEEQGDSSKIFNPWRRAECFIDGEGNYDWDKHQGQQWFLQEAKKHGVEKILMFANAAPVHYSNNGLAFAPKGEIKLNLKPEHYHDYANYMVAVVNHFTNQKNITIDYLSPFNEPQWNWDKGKQEGTPATNSEMFKLVKLLSHKLDSTNSSTQIVFGEAGQINYLHKDVNDEDRDNQVEFFFNPQSKGYIGALPNVLPIISGHSYFTTWPLKKQVNSRVALAKDIDKMQPNLGYWQSEFCILEKNEETKGGVDRDLGMNTALYVARVIHNDMVITNARSWQWWTAISQVDFKDGLIHIDLGGDSKGVWANNKEGLEKIKHDGSVKDTKLMWALGNYSRFIRPGSVRVNAQVEGQNDLLESSKGVMLSAYKSMDNKIILVVTNMLKESALLNLSKHHRRWNRKKMNVYVTSQNKNLEKVDVKFDNIQIAARSVTTIVLDD
ncbi:MAG: glycosyl hydrolase [Bacteroidales bacterium]|nr:glycosyl hydrolase [Bacteroidales bacterium]